MQNCLDAIMSKHSKESDEEGLQQVMTSAFTYTIKEIAKTVHDHDDLTTVGFQIVYTTYPKTLQYIIIDAKYTNPR